MTHHEIIACGSRDGQGMQVVERALNQFDREILRIDHAIVGSYRGTDRAIFDWALKVERVATVVSAKWLTGGNKRAEGPIRNERMPRLFPNVKAVLAFPGGDGTESMVGIAKRLHIPVWRCIVHGTKWEWARDDG